MTAFLSGQMHIMHICNWLCGMGVPGMMASTTGIGWVKLILSIVGEINVTQDEGNITLL